MLQTFVVAAVWQWLIAYISIGLSYFFWLLKSKTCLKSVESSSVEYPQPLQNMITLI